MKLLTSILLSVAGGLALAGCGTVASTYLPPETTKYSIENTGKFALLDHPTQTAITCTGLQERLDAAGRLEVVANVKNRESTAIQVRVRCVFKDGNGFATGDETAWQTLHLGDEATEAVRFTAINSVAQKYTILVRSAP